VSDKRKHRGPHPSDREIFSAEHIPRLRLAAADYIWLRNRGYAGKAALSLVGNRYDLVARQRLALSRFACTDAERESRNSRQLADHELTGRNLLIDTYNVLITVEAALSGGIVLVGRDGAYRDLAGVHGTFRRVEETVPAIRHIGSVLERLQPASCCWLVDRPVSNSGRLKGLLLEQAAALDWPWSVELVYNPDGRLIEASDPVASADSIVLDRCRSWHNLARRVVESLDAPVWLIDLVG